MRWFTDCSTQKGELKSATTGSRGSFGRQVKRITVNARGEEKIEMDRDGNGGFVRCIAYDRSNSVA
jgi:hypothetical protein